MLTGLTHYDWLIIGGGFKSLVTAYSLRKQDQSILLLERSGVLGGFMSPIRWGEFWIDKGPQLFENFEEKDRAFITEMVGDGVLEDIGFKYTSYMNGRRTEGFAIPDWRAQGVEFAVEVFKDLLAAQIARGASAPEKMSTFADLLAVDGGIHLTPMMEALTQKFMRRNATELSPHACRVATFVGRKLLFDQDVSVDLKRSQLLDSFLAALKKAVKDTRSNLYPKGSNLEKVRAAMEHAVRSIGVNVVTESGDVQIDITAKSCAYLGQEARFGRAFFGCDVGVAETMLLGTDTLTQQAHFLPEIFHCFAVPGEALDEVYYLVDYDPDHLSTRMTNFSNYMTAYDDEGYGAFCVEQAIDRKSADWEDPTRAQDRIFKEAQEVGNVTCDRYKAAKSFRIPVTYKVPLVGYAETVAELETRLQDLGGDDFLIPNPMSLTRKEILEDLRALALLEG